MTIEDLEFAIQVLELPLGPSFRWEETSDVARERARVYERYEVLKGAGHGPGWALLRSRAEWLQEWLASRQAEQS